MNIKPLSQTTSTKIQFAGKNKKQPQKSAQTQPQISINKAVPLAVLIAMSPLVTAGSPNISDKKPTPVENTMSDIVPDNVNLIKTEKYRGNDGITRKLYYVGNTENSSKVNDIYINDGDLDGKRITEYKNITLKLVGDDGVEGKTFKFPQLTVEATNDAGSVYGYTERNISAQLAKFLLSDENKTNIKTKNITKKVNAGKYGLENANHESTYWTKVAHEGSFGKPVAGWTKKIDDHTYMINAYSKDRNLKDYEVVTIKRAGGPEFVVTSLKNVTSSLIDAGSPIGDFNYKQITVLKNKDTSVARIFNDVLFADLEKLLKDPANKAFKLENVEETQIVDHKGNIYDVE